MSITSEGAVVVINCVAFNVSALVTQHYQTTAPTIIQLTDRIQFYLHISMTH